MSRLERLQSALTSEYHAFTFYDPATTPASVMAALSLRLPHIDPKSWEARFDFGGVYLNGEELTSNRPLTPPCRIEYYEPKFDFTQAVHEQLDPNMIVYEDDHLIALAKPAGLSCIQSRENRRLFLKRMVEDYTRKPVHVPSRLDVSAQGLVVMSKAPPMHKHLQQAFERHRVEKYYIAVVSPPVPWKKKLVDNLLGEDPAHPILRQVVSAGGQKATTYFVHIETRGNQSAVLAKPRTGRTHQLRVHLSSLGHPIVGDNFYSGEPAELLHLACIRMRFLNPLRKALHEIALEPRHLPDWLDPQWLKVPDSEPQNAPS